MFVIVLSDMHIKMAKNLMFFQPYFDLNLEYGEF